MELNSMEFGSRKSTQPLLDGEAEQPQPRGWTLTTANSVMLVLNLGLLVLFGTHNWNQNQTRELRNKFLGHTKPFQIP